MKRERMFVCLMAILLLFTACGNSDDQVTEPTGIPSRMVERIDIAIYPEDEALARTYTDKDQMSPILRILRDMDTPNEPEETPSLTDGQTYYTITATYASGESRVYYLLSHKFLRIGDGSWCEIDNADAMELIQYIRGTSDEPTEEESQPEASEETAPDETGETENADETAASE